jgi:hypothetical protein
VLQRDENLWSEEVRISCVVAWVSCTYPHAQALARRKVETAKIDKYITALFFPEEASYQFVPYQQYSDNCAFDLPLTQAMDKEAWDAAKKMDRHHESPNDLPVAAWRADVDQPAFEIAELGNRMASEFKAMETAAYRRDTIGMEEIARRIKLQLRAVDGLVQLQMSAIASASTNN